MEQCAKNGIALEYYDFHGITVSEQSHPQKPPVKKVLFDESHGELLRAELNEEDDEVDSWSKLSEVLTGELNWKVDSHTVDQKALTHEVLQGYDVLVLGAPTKPLTSDELDAVTSFVHLGKSLLIANSFESIWRQNSINNINKLLKTFGLCAQRLVSSLPKKVSSFQPHYISSDVNRLSIREPTYLKILNDNPRVVATLPETYEPFLATVEAGSGRIVAVGDFALFGNWYIEQDNNQLIVTNIFRWLARQNFLDFEDIHIDPEVKFGQQALLSLNLVNPQDNLQLSNIRCFLASDMPTHINYEQFTVRSILANEKKGLKWFIEPRKLGLQNLKLKIDFPEGITHSPLYFEHLSQFICVPDAEIDFVFFSGQNEIQEVETGVSFDAKVIVRWPQDAKKVPLNFSIDYPSSSIKAEQISADHWRLTAVKKGNCKIELKIEETGQTRTRLIHIFSSLQSRISDLERDTVEILTSKVHHRVSCIWQEFSTDSIRNIPFRLFTPETLVQKVYPRHTRERLLEVLRAARGDLQRFLPLADELLRYVAPTYLPKQGCCIPFDPGLATHLAKKYPSREENLAYNLLSIDGDERYDESWVEGNIVALLLHEKYGHGFFHTQTTLGRQLALLNNHGLLRRVDYKELNSPYLCSLHKEYGEAIQILAHSALLINEGFAAWVELTGLQKLAPAFNQVFYRRKEFLFQDTQLARLINHSGYFKKFHPGPGSQYRIMYDFLNAIQNCFDPDIGPQCALHAMIKAADVDFGITEQNGRIQFGMSANEIQDRLLDNTEGFEAGADQRMRHIWKVIEDHQEQLQEDMIAAKHNPNYLHSGSSVNKIIEEQLGW
ncbi:MAG: hypothetical protein QNJ46_03045 [Leptolyngbyaceae cyanobacterium MO_188.B28]|nr:hypothetical protein [Leptolyngbyaceae cyanobacterium MO_188.B28]